MSITSVKIEGIGESGFLEHASYTVAGEGNSEAHTFTFHTQQPCEVAKHTDGSVSLTIVGQQEFADVLNFINEAVSS